MHASARPSQAQSCQLYVGQFTDVPAGDINVGAREIGYLFGQYRASATNTGQCDVARVWSSAASLAFVPKASSWAAACATSHAERPRALRGGSPEARPRSPAPATWAIFATEKAQALGASADRLRIPTGYIYDPNGIQLDAWSRTSSWPPRPHQGATPSACRVPNAQGCKGVDRQATIALPCATQNEIDEESWLACWWPAAAPWSARARACLHPGGRGGVQGQQRLYGPAKAANAGGVAVSGLEMSQNSYRLAWSFEETDAKLKGIMESIVANTLAAAKEYGEEGDLMAGANIAGFVKVADAMVAQGWC
ncbi:MAG: hypothetical protein ACLUUF_07550 [Bifidobacterium pullorum]